MCNRKEIMARAWEIKRQDSRNLFGECLRMAWAESRIKRIEGRIVKREIAYADFKKIGELADGVTMKKGAYHADTKTIDITLSFDKYFLCEKDEVSMRERFMKMSDENIVFSCEVERMAVKAGVTSRFALRNGCDMYADEDIDSRFAAASGKDKETYRIMKEVRSRIFCVEILF